MMMDVTVVVEAEAKERSRGSRVVMCGCARTLREYGWFFSSMGLGIESTLQGDWTNDKIQRTVSIRTTTVMFDKID